MLVEFSIIPLGSGTHLSEDLVEVLRLVDASGLPYQLTPSGTCIEGTWDDVMGLVRRCHETMRERSPHVFTTIRIEDEEGEREKLTRNVASIEEKIGRRLARTLVETSGPEAPQPALPPT